MRDELAKELTDLYPAFAQLAELLVRVVINDREFSSRRSKCYLPRGQK